MKKLLFLVAAILILAFIYITYSKTRTDKKSQKTESALSAEEKENLRAFWKVYREATDLRINREWVKAIEKYKSALELNPIHEDAIYYIGNMYLETGQELRAENSWLKLVKLNPESARAHFQLGNLYMHSGLDELRDLDKATKEFEITFSINKDFQQPLIRLGQISLLKGDLENARNYFQTVLGTDVANIPSNYLNGYIFWKAGNADKALKYFRLACQNPTPAQPKGVTNEGDTKGGKSLQRKIHNNLFESFFTDLPNPESDNFISEMNLEYQKLDSFLVN